MDIITNAKRGKSKVTSNIGMKDFYKSYVERSKLKERKPVPINVFRSIIDDFNKALVSEIVFNNEVIKLPYRLGFLGIKKYKVNFDPERKNIWPVNYQKSKELGFIVYYDQEYRYRWKWLKEFSKVTGRRWYKFLPCRANKRLIAQALRENSTLDYCEKLV